MLSPTSDARSAAASKMENKVVEEVQDINLEEAAHDADKETGEDADEETRLKMLTTATRDQEDLERDIGRQADQLLMEQENERDKKRAEKAETEIKRHQAAIAKMRVRFHMPMLEPAKIKLRAEIGEYEKKIEACEKDLEAIQKRIDDRFKAQYGEEEDGTDNAQKPLPNESRRAFLIRTGKITPFSKIGQADPSASGLANVMVDAETELMMAEGLNGEQGDKKAPVSHRNLMQPGFSDENSSSSVSTPASSPRPAKRRRVSPAPDESELSSAPETPQTQSDDAYIPELDDRELAALGESDDISVGASDDDDYEVPTTGRKRKPKSKDARTKKTSKARRVEEEEKEDLAGLDDGNEKVYQSRLRKWAKNRSAARRRLQERSELEAEGEHDAAEECYLPCPSRPDGEIDEGFRIPGDIYPSLFDYQKTGIEWLWQLYGQSVGGILGDEMGLGKTIQVISFLAGLHHSKQLTKPVIVVCPATVMKQWVNEFHKWWPAFRVSILHTSGSGMLDTKREDRMEKELERRGFGDFDETLTKRGKAAKRVVEKVKRDGHILVTTYSGLQTYAEFLIPTEWQYAVLDEGHKIRNPNTSITIHCKELQTPNRIILSGTPIQNNLTELWSLFDFVYPMRLGTLVNFKTQFEIPIKQGGYANAGNLQYETAVRCAETLKDAISPYLLQRFKVDVATDLPEKKEKILFCKLTRQQREAYEKFLSSGEMQSILNGKRQMLYGVDYLRKVCNHPDLLEHKEQKKKLDPNYGAGSKSGKMQVVKELLSMWKKGGHKTLLFAQHRITLDILEKFVQKMPGINYRRMDGETAIKNRQDLVDEFNNDPDLHVFLLTTKVGGLGVNLTGADRVIIFDPDWNPSTDAQARERSWRLGQKREVEIFRLMTAGTIEEKIYHRQIFKQFLTNKVLKDPSQQQTFQMSDLYDLFTLGTEAADGQTETGHLFKGSEVKFDDQSATTIPTPPNAEDEQIKSLIGIHHTEAVQVENPAPASDGDASKAATGEEGKSDDRLLSSIFARSGVHAAIEHDKVVGSTNSRKRKVEADPKFIAREAKRYAAEAAEALRKAEEVAKNIPIGVPTWTGEQGEAGRPQPPPPRFGGGRGGMLGGRGGRGGPSSMGVLANLAVRQGRGNTPSSSSTPQSSRASTPTRPRGRQMLEMIRDFLSVHGGVVPTQMLIDHFDRYCRAPGAEAEFKELLKTVARFEKGARAQRGRWILKDEWRIARQPGAG
ncbi:DNA repair and recombination protein RAD26 [Delitschia confertaspora ATCC 74209]|uniref:DNA repair and recombination protein RAD26 n=1 Tax=Delitschia confertaspora ATCC 74209 TaxID=1513339 RepID=A0A9P4JVL5_9PLEO|nr:DNA repair and recombination protein RAD26 [Delitschia confertaspora ATCC 74209]